MHSRPAAGWALRSTSDDIGRLLGLQQLALGGDHPGLHEAHDAVGVGGELGHVLERLPVRAEHVAHGSVRLDPAAVEPERPLGDALDGGEVVGDEHEGGAVR